MKKMGLRATSGDPDAARRRLEVLEGLPYSGYEPVIICTPEELSEVER
jgi:hypothetical protein